VGLMAHDWIEIIGLTGGAIAFIFGLRQYASTQKWKTKEFVASEFDKFTSKREVRLALTLLDWRDREIELFPQSETRYKERFVVVTDDLLVSALAPHTESTGFDYKEAALRDVFDEFLTALERFDSFLQAGLVKSSDLKPYFHYWIDVLSRDPREPVRSALWTFVRAYDYQAVISFVQRLDGTVPSA